MGHRNEEFNDIKESGTTNNQKVEERSVKLDQAIHKCSKEIKSWKRAQRNKDEAVALQHWVTIKAMVDGDKDLRKWMKNNKFKAGKSMKEAEFGGRDEQKITTELAAKEISTKQRFLNAKLYAKKTSSKNPKNTESESLTTTGYTEKDKSHTGEDPAKSGHTDQMDQDSSSELDEDIISTVLENLDESENAEDKTNNTTVKEGQGS